MNLGKCSQGLGEREGDLSSRPGQDAPVRLGGGKGFSKLPVRMGFEAMARAIDTGCVVKERFPLL